MGRLTLKVANDALCKHGATHAHTVNLKVFDHPLNIVPGLAVRNRFDPVDDIDAGFARIAKLPHPAFCRLWAGVVRRDGKDVGAVEPVDHLAKIGLTQPNIVSGITRQLLW